MDAAETAIADHPDDGLDFFDGDDRPGVTTHRDYRERLRHWVGCNHDLHAYDYGEALQRSLAEARISHCELNPENQTLSFSLPPITPEMAFIPVNLRRSILRRCVCKTPYGPHFIIRRDARESIKTWLSERVVHSESLNSESLKYVSYGSGMLANDEDNISNLLRQIKQGETGIQVLDIVFVDSSYSSFISQLLSREHEGNLVSVDSELSSAYFPLLKRYLTRVVSHRNLRLMASSCSTSEDLAFLRHLKQAHPDVDLRPLLGYANELGARIAFLAILETVARIRHTQAHFAPLLHINVSVVPHDESSYLAGAADIVFTEGLEQGFEWNIVAWRSTLALGGVHIGNSKRPDREWAIVYGFDLVVGRTGLCIPVSWGFGSGGCYLFGMPYACSFLWQLGTPLRKHHRFKELFIKAGDPDGPVSFTKDYLNSTVKPFWEKLGSYAQAVRNKHLQDAPGFDPVLRRAELEASAICRVDGSDSDSDSLHALLPYLEFLALVAAFMLSYGRRETGIDGKLVRASRFDVDDYLAWERRNAHVLSPPPPPPTPAPAPAPARLAARVAPPADEAEDTDYLLALALQSDEYAPQPSPPTPTPAPAPAAPPADEAEDTDYLLALALQSDEYDH